MSGTMTRFAVLAAVGAFAVGALAAQERPAAPSKTSEAG